MRKNHGGAIKQEEIVKLPKYVYHGTTADPLDIVLHGIEAREDREGVSVSTKPSRAMWWAGLKRGDAFLIRIPSAALSKFDPENAFPADPRYDFTTDRLISPAVLEVETESGWVPLFDVYGPLMEDTEVVEWERKWT